MARWRRGMADKIVYRLCVLVLVPCAPRGYNKPMRCRPASLLAFACLAISPGRVARAQAARGAAKPQKSTGQAWQIITPPQSSLVYARDGSLIGEIGTQWRTNVSIGTLPKYVGEAFIAVEDKRFYQHNGVDVVGIAGAIKDNLLGSSRGASTIT